MLVLKLNSSSSSSKITRGSNPSLLQANLIINSKIRYVLILFFTKHVSNVKKISTNVYLSLKLIRKPEMCWFKGVMRGSALCRKKKALVFFKIAWRNESENGKLHRGKSNESTYDRFSNKSIFSATTIFSSSNVVLPSRDVLRVSTHPPE